MTSGTSSSLDSAAAVQLYRGMIVIRKFEMALDRLFASGVIRGTAHFCVGQEAAAVGACSVLRPGDYVISNHRGHGHFLAQGGDPKRLMAELFGKETGYSAGRGGSQHMASFAHGFLGSNGITGGGIPVGTGAALALKLQHRAGVVLVFFGDGACNQGAFHESLNLASVWKLPVVYLCENNLYSMSTRIDEAIAVADIAARAPGYAMPGSIADGNDLLDVRDKTRLAVDRARAGAGPSLIECKTYRLLGHSKSDKRLYRTREEEAEWEARDPIPRFRKFLIETAATTETRLRQIDEEVDLEMAEAVQFAEKSPFPSGESLEGSLFA